MDRFPTFAPMQKLKSIVLLSLIGLACLPWALLDFCITHPTGHHHHGPGPSACELRKMYKGSTPAYFPPMHCHKFSMKTDRFQSSEKAVKPFVFPALAEQPSLMVLPAIIAPETPVLSPPDPKCNAGPPLATNTLRGPPVV